MVQQLAIHSVGGVVTPAQAWTVMVTNSPSVSAEVAIANLGIGFVNAGQEARPVANRAGCYLAIRGSKATGNSLWLWRG